MARPKTTRDIEIKKVKFGEVDFNQIATDAALLKGYTAFLDAVSKAGADVDQTPYSGVHFYRTPSQTEMQDQLRSAQNVWDEGQKYYEHLATIGDTEYPWQRNSAQRWAEAEELPFPPVCEPISDFHSTIAAIDEVIG